MLQDIAMNHIICHQVILPGKTYRQLSELHFAAYKDAIVLQMMCTLALIIHLCWQIIKPH